MSEVQSASIVPDRPDQAVLQIACSCEPHPDWDQPPQCV